jgi:hypothetical protein
MLVALKGAGLPQPSSALLTVATHAATANVAVTPGVPHVFQSFAAMLDEGDAALTSAAVFLRAHLAAPRAK